MSATEHKNLKSKTFSQLPRGCFERRVDNYRQIILNLIIGVTQTNPPRPDEIFAL